MGERVAPAGTRSPRRFGPWEVVGDLGRGGYATVYRARHAKTGSAAALKVLGPEGATPDEVRRFQREVALTRDLDHPGIVRVLDVGDDGTSPWFAMELIEGRPLFQIISEEQFPWRRAVEIARDVADALAHAHSRGVLHRDVKPGNILLGQKVVSRLPFPVCRSDEPTSQRETTSDKRQATAPRAYLADFGLARLATTASRLTRTGMALGTPEYMSPEQAQGEMHALSGSTDVWSLGCVLYEMLAGRVAFEGDSLETVVEAVVLRAPVPLRRLRLDIPAGLARVVDRCLAKRPSARYPDGAALRDDLDRVLRGERPRARGPRPLRLALALVALAGAGIAWGDWLARLAPAPGEATGPAPSALLPGPAPGPDALAAEARARRFADPRAAAEILGRAIAGAPEGPDRDLWRVERGLALWASGDVESARTEWRLVPDASAQAPAARFYEALEEILRLGGGRVLPQLETAAKGNGREARLARGVLCGMRGDWAGSRALLASESGWEPAVLLGYVESHDPRGDHAAAVRHFDDALAEGVRLPWIFNSRGACKVHLLDSDGAWADFEEALRRQPDYPLALANRGALRVRRGDATGALADLDAALRLKPGLLEALVNRGATRLGLGQLDGARADFEAALRLRPGRLDARSNLAEVLWDQGEFTAAAAQLRECLRRFPEGSDSPRLRSRLEECEARARAEPARAR